MSHHLPPITNTNTLIFLTALDRLKVRYRILEEETGKIQLFFNHHSHIVTKHSFGLNSRSSLVNSKSKIITRQLLKNAGLPILNQWTVKSISAYQNLTNKLPYPQVIKPISGQKGRHVYLNIKDKNQAQSALKLLLKDFPDGAIIEPYFPATDYRFFVLAGQVIGSTKRLPPQITGDGQQTIKQLIDQENQGRLELSQTTGRRLLNRLHVWPRISWYLHQQGYTLDNILPKRKTITLYPLPNFSTGGSSHTLPLTQFHPSLLKTAAKAAQSLDLTVAGVDLLIKNHAQDTQAGNCVITDVNSDPSLRLHDWPNTGQSQHVAEKLIRYLISSKTK